MLKYYNKTIIKKEGVLQLKKIGFLLALVMTVFSMTGCGKKNEVEGDVKLPVVLNEESDSSNENSNNETEIKQEEEKEVEKPSLEFNENDSFDDGRIYYYEAFSEKNYFVNIKLPKDNEQKLSAIIDSLKSLPNNDLLEDVEHQEFTPLPEALSINSAEFKDDLIKIDFNLNFADGLGTSGETSVIESLVKTIEHNFSVKKVIITFNNKNYESGHIVMEDDEWFAPNNKESIELKNFKK